MHLILKKSPLTHLFTNENRTELLQSDPILLCLELFKCDYFESQSAVLVRIPLIRAFYGNSVCIPPHTARLRFPEHGANP